MTVLSYRYLFLRSPESSVKERTTAIAAENSDPPTGSEPPPPKRSRLGPRKTEPRRKPRLNYHGIRCTICNHPEREAIEQAFLQWHRPGDLAREFKITHRTAIYRHAKALGLFQRRAREMHFALGRIIEEAEHVKPTANSIIRAIRASSCLDDNGRWTDPPRRIIITNVSGKNLCPACLKPEEEPSETSQEPKSIATTVNQKSA